MASIPSQFTNKLIKRLKDSGYSDSEINNMTPATGWAMVMIASIETQGARFCKVSAWNDPGDSPGKNPNVGKTGWQDRPLTWDEVKSHVKNGGNVGMICGKHSGGIILLDIDNDLPGFFAEFPQYENYPRIERGHPDKGKILLRLPTGQDWKGQKYRRTPQDKPFLEILATGNQGVIPPSKHPDGVFYYGVNIDSTIPTIDPAKLAADVARWVELVQIPTPASQPATAAALPDRIDTQPGGGDDNIQAVKNYWTPLRVFEKFGYATNGTRTERGYIRVFGNGGLFCNPDGVHWNVPGNGNGAGGNMFDAWHYCETNGKEYKVPDGQFGKILKTMAAAAGIAIKPAPKVTPSQAPTNGAPSTANQTNAQPVKNPKNTVPDDSQLAARWLAANNNTAWGMGEFRRYDGGIYQVQELDIIRKELKAIIDAARYEGVRPTNGRLNSVLELTRVEVAINASLWDANHDYLICNNGALHIPSKQLDPHNPALFATSKLDFDYDPGATCPTFLAVLAKCIPDSAAFVQEFAGYSLTTDTSHELALWFYGPPGSGKSTILGGLQAMLGARAGLLGLADIERSRFALNNLPGKTLVVSTEQPESFMAATHILNAIISGEPITIEQKFRDAINIIPRAKVAWAMNDLPRVNGANNGIMRRVKVIKFPAMTESERDPEVKERIKTEGAGILNWALIGLARLQARGKFIIPQCVADATNDFKNNNDVPALFLEDAGAMLGNQYKTAAGLLYEKYRTWCQENGHKPQSSTSMAAEWLRLGFERSKANGRAFWHGVGFFPNLP